MIAAFESKGALHVIKWTGRIRLHAEAIAYCDERIDASHGVVQVPDGVFEHGIVFNSNGSKLKACSKCRLAVQASIG